MYVIKRPAGVHEHAQMNKRKKIWPWRAAGWRYSLQMYDVQQIFVIISTFNYAEISWICLHINLQLLTQGLYSIPDRRMMFVKFDYCCIAILLTKSSFLIIRQVRKVFKTVKLPRDSASKAFIRAFQKSPQEHFLLREFEIWEVLWFHWLTASADWCLSHASHLCAVLTLLCILLASWIIIQHTVEPHLSAICLNKHSPGFWNALWWRLA